MEEGATELSTIVGVCVEDEVGVGEAHSEVVLGELRLGCVEGHLVANQPVLVAGNCSTIDDGTTQVQGGVQVDGEGVSLVSGLEHSRLLASLGSEGGVQDQLEALCNLILNGNLCVEGVVCVPLLSEGQACKSNKVINFIYTFSLIILPSPIPLNVIRTIY